MAYDGWQKVPVDPELPMPSETHRSGNGDHVPQKNCMKHCVKSDEDDNHLNLKREGEATIAMRLMLAG